MGKNEWRECNKLYINSTFNLPEAAYALIYSFYSDIKLIEDDLEIITDKSRIFKKHVIEELKQNFILHNLYQTIKRINRDVDKKSDIYVICNNQHFIRNIKVLLDNVAVKFDYAIDLPTILPANHKMQQREKFMAIDEELKRMVSNAHDKSQLQKTLFCLNIGIEGKRLKKEMYVGYIKELCEGYGVDYDSTFKKGSRYFFFK